MKLTLGILFGCFLGGLSFNLFGFVGLLAVLPVCFLIGLCIHD